MPGRTTRYVDKQTQTSAQELSTSVILTDAAAALKGPKHHQVERLGTQSRVEQLEDERSTDQVGDSYREHDQMWYDQDECLKDSSRT